MSKISNAHLLEQLQWRYAVKRFDAAKKISESDWKTLEQALVLTPSSYGLQPWQFIVVTNDELRKQLQTVSWNQTQVTDCSHFVVFAAKDKILEQDIERFIARTVEVRNASASALDAYKNMMIDGLIKGPRAATVKEWAARQTYIALGNLMTSAALLGIDTCPMEGIEPPKYDEILKLHGTGFHTVMTCAVGYRHAADQYGAAAKVRFAPAEVVKYLR